MSNKRIDGREFNQLREVKIVTNYVKHAEGSCLIEMGDTKVLCTCSIEDKVPPFLVGNFSGWITAEYSMLPRATKIRMPRERTNRHSGRSYEIQRLIGRSLRAVVDLSLLGERTIWIDCDVLQADGGTRCAAISGAFVALAETLAHLQDKKIIEEWPIKDFVAAVSVGIINNNILLDLNYAEDQSAEVDMNLVMTSLGKLVEVQVTAEKKTFTQHQLNELIEVGKVGINQLIEIQRKALAHLEKRF